MHPLVRFSTVLLVLAFVLSLAACGNSSSINQSIPPTPQYLYVANNSQSGAMAQYTLPLSSTSKANFTLAVNGIVGLLPNSAGDLICINSLTGEVSVYDAPLGASSTPAIVFSGPPAPVGLALDTAGNLYLGSNSEEGVYVYDHPLTSSTTLSTSIANGIYFVDGIVFDSSGNLIVTNDNNLNNTASLAVFAPPYSGAPTVTTSAVSNAWYMQPAMSGSQLFVPNWGGASLDVYALPLTSTSAPTFSIPNLQGAAVAAVDKGGNLYVGSTQGTLYMFASPISASSAPAVTLNVTTGGTAWQINGITAMP